MTVSSAPSDAETGPDDRAGTAARRYAAALLAVMALTGLALWLLAGRLGPPVGDLVRISGKAERAFGWRGEVPGFEGRHYARVSARELMAGEVRADLVVFGDSFSVPKETSSSWLDHLHAATGLRVAWVRMTDFRAPLAYLRSDAFRADPPEAVIVQTVERELIARARGVPGAGCPELPAPVAAGGAPAALPERSFRRRTEFESFDARMSWGALAARLRLTGGGPVLELPLTADGLFTSRASDRLLILENDVTFHEASALGAPPERAAREAACGLRRLIASGGGRAFLAVAPDKRTIYAPWIAAELPEKALDGIAVAGDALGPAAIGLRGPLSAAVEGGVRDVYWPDDTHWGAAGHRIAGEATARALSGAPAGGGR